MGQIKPANGRNVDVPDLWAWFRLKESRRLPILEASRRKKHINKLNINHKVNNLSSRGVECIF